MLLWASAVSFVEIHFQAQHARAQPAADSTAPSLSHASFTHLHVIQQPLEIQTPLSSIPVVVGSDIFKPSIHKDGIVVL